MLQDNGVRNLFALIQAVRDSLEDGYDDTEYLTGEAGLEEDPVAEEESGGEEDDEAYETWSEEEAWNENWEEKDGSDANAGEPEPAEPAENQEEDAPEPEHPAGKKRRSSLTRARSSKKLRRMGSYRKKKSGISIASSAPDTPPAKLPRKDTGESYVDPVTASKQAELDSILAMIGRCWCRMIPQELFGNWYRQLMCATIWCRMTGVVPVAELQTECHGIASPSPSPLLVFTAPRVSKFSSEPGPHV